MFLNKISLLNYKNFEQKVLHFKDKFNCLIGDNGVGKTNVLDAIYHLSLTKSYLGTHLSQSIKHGSDYFMLEGHYDTKQGKTISVVSSLKKGEKRIFKKDGKVYEKISEHIGKIPLVMISPYDQDLIISGSEPRRKFMDNLISQQDTIYLQDLLHYKKALSQRNALLKFFATNHTFDPINLKIYNEQLVHFGKRIHQKRKDFWKFFNMLFEKYYGKLSSNKEPVNLTYQSPLEKMGMQKILQKNLQKDRALQYTSLGIHKDDLIFEIQGHAIKKIGSQGQQKSYLIALKLAKFDMIYQKSGIQPIFLLDDIFDKLDHHRVSQLIDLVHKDDFGQIFITDTHTEHVEQSIEKTRQAYQIFNL